MAFTDSRCSGESLEILWRSNHTVDNAPLMGVYGLSGVTSATGKEQYNTDIIIRAGQSDRIPGR
jgi:hypothetical protein